MTIKSKNPFPKRSKTKKHKKNALQKPSAEYGSPGGEVVLYRAPDGTIALDVHLEKETIWLNLNQMADPYDRDNYFISKHLNAIFKKKELKRNATVAFFAKVQDKGGRMVSRKFEYFNLDAIISVGYRINSNVANTLSKQFHY